MAYNGGSGVFDGMATVILNMDLDEEQQVLLLAALIKELEYADWDCISDTAYYSHPIYLAALEKLDQEYE